MELVTPRVGAVNEGSEQGMRVTFWARLDFAREAVSEALAAVSGVTVLIVSELEDLLAALSSTDFLVLVDAPPENAREIVARLKEPSNPVRWMHFNSMGREGFDAVGIPAHIEVTRAVGALAPTVASHAMALALALRRQLPAALNAQRQGIWNPGMAGSMRGMSGDTMLVVGFGQIGRAVARLSQAFGMRVIATNRTVHKGIDVEELHPLSALPELVGEADVIVLCVALTSDTRCIVDGRLLERCRRHAIIVNVGRGGLVDTSALTDALRDGRIAGAGLDVLDLEPPNPDEPLMSAPNVILTPHVAGAGPQGETAIAKAAAEQLRQAIAESL